MSRLQNKGWEFISHTHSHVKITTSSEEKLIREFEDSIAALKEHGCESRYLVYPYNAIDTEKMALVKKYFSAGIGLGGNNENTLPLYTHHLRRYSINNANVLIEREYQNEMRQVYSFQSLETLKGYLDDAITNGGWVIIMTHLRNDGSFYFDDEARQMIVDLCKYAIENGMEIQTFGEAFESYENVLEEGTIGDKNYYIVDCNGVIHTRGE